MISRRSFFIGLAAAAAVTKLPPMPASACIPSRLWLAKGFDWAAIHEMAFSCMTSADEPSGREPVTYKLYRQDDKDAALYAVQLHPHATMRWVAMDEAEIPILTHHPLRMDIEPCYTNCVVTLIYNVERSRDKRKKFFSEVFHYRGDKEITHELHALNYEDEHLIKRMV